MKTIVTAADAESIREQVEVFAGDLWATDARGRVDWEDWADRFELYHPDIDLGNDMTSAGFRRVQSIARHVIRESIL